MRSDDRPFPPTGHDIARRHFRWFMLAAFAVLAAGIGLRDPWPPDEPRFALVVRQMLASGQWLFPHRGIELYADKPPLMMWCQAALSWLLHGWRGAFLLPSLLAGLGTLATVYHLGRRLWDARTGLVAATLVLAAMQFVDVAKHAQIDPLLLLWITLGNAGLLLHCLRGPDWRAYWLGCFAAGLGVITKGVGVLVLLMLVPYAWARWHGWPGLAAAPGGGSNDGNPAGAGRSHPPHERRGDGWRWAGGALAFLLPILLWLLPMLAVAYAHHTPAYLRYVHDLLFRQTAERYAHAWAHHQPPWYFLGVMAQDWFPTCLLVPLLLPAWRRALRGREPRVLLPLGWWLLALAFFSLSGGKRAIYLLPALPMAALAMAPYTGPLLRTRWLPRLAFALGLAMGVAFVGAGLWGWLGQPRVALRIAAGLELAHGGRALWWCVLATGAAFLLAAAAFRPRRGTAALLAGLAAAWVVWSCSTWPLLNDNRSARALMRRADALAGPQGQLALVQWREELMLQARRPVVEFGFSRPPGRQLRMALAWQSRAPARRWILLDGEALALDACIDPARAARLGVANRNTWWMFDATALRPACRMPP